jgi:hypothetical protein
MPATPNVKSRLKNKSKPKTKTIKSKTIKSKTTESRSRSKLSKSRAVGHPQSAGALFGIGKSSEQKAADAEKKAADAEVKKRVDAVLPEVRRALQEIRSQYRDVLTGKKTTSAFSAFMPIKSEVESRKKMLLSMINSVTTVLGNFQSNGKLFVRLLAALAKLEHAVNPDYRGTVIWNPEDEAIKKSKKGNTKEDVAKSKKGNTKEDVAVGEIEAAFKNGQAVLTKLTDAVNRINDNNLPDQT